MMVRKLTHLYLHGHPLPCNHTSWGCQRSMFGVLPCPHACTCACSRILCKEPRRVASKTLSQAAGQYRAAPAPAEDDWRHVPPGGGPGAETCLQAAWVAVDQETAEFSLGPGLQTRMRIEKDSSRGNNYRLHCCSIEFLYRRTVKLQPPYNGVLRTSRTVSLPEYSSLQNFTRISNGQVIGI